MPVKTMERMLTVVILLIALRQYASFVHTCRSHNQRRDFHPAAYLPAILVVCIESNIVAKCIIGNSDVGMQSLHQSASFVEVNSTVDTSTMTV